jgi:hypothetical protein
MARQRRRREAEAAARRGAVTCLRWMRRRGSSEGEVAARLALPRATLRQWESGWQRRRSSVLARGRPARHATRLERVELSAELNAEGLGLSVRELKRRHPAIARREIAERRALYRRVLVRRRARSLARLEWTWPGTVWAGDFTQPESLIDGEWKKLQLVRDLASQEQLLALPAYGESAAEVALALERLFGEHGAPLVLKLDGGPGYRADETHRLCQRHGVIILHSPPRTPSYNGSCEAGGGSMKCRALRIAAARRRDGVPTSDDFEAARLQANAVTREAGPSPGELWAARAPIPRAERADFLRRYRRQRGAEQARLGLAPGALPAWPLSATIERVALAAALAEHGLLKIWRG